MRSFEDLREGDTFDLGAVSLSEADIVAFAREWDPQPMHTNAGGAADRLFDGLIASGWQTVCLWMRQLCDNLLHDARSMGSPGVEQLRWKKPVRPGDTLSMRVRIVETRGSASRPTIGFVKVAGEAVNQHGDLVMTLVCMIMFERREPAVVAG
ncbi:MaoC family dehydratase [Lutibaculum baratangense]|uniref:Acyl dehydratase n=1 Tax=Lutibaculum baratangense AMV1 TaxID=631454 RepID=V4RAG9_9HYPH|nr:MaoC family dehydratase [Lutibaculum baratangense]ESR23176.1 Acyl dehydratase [Lutibaculum baratangense AMV1]